MRAPLDPQFLPAPSSSVVHTAGEHRLSLLLVEDDRADALLVEELIADAAADIGFTWAQSISDAERKLADARPDCVLLDLNLPDANGIDALHRMAKLGCHHPDHRAHRAERRALRGFRGRVGCPGLPGQGSCRPGDAAAGRRLLHRAQAGRAHGGGPAREPPARPGERATRTRACCPPRCSWTTRASTSSRSHGRADRTPCSAATSTTSSRLLTAPST